MDDAMGGLVFTDQSAEVLCPKCQTTMMFCTMACIKSVGCTGCQGQLIDGDTFGQLVQVLRRRYRGMDQIPARPTEEALKMQRQCPACHSVMDTHPYYGPGNVVIDACRQCALVWLDEKELTQIVQAPGRR